MLAAAKPVDGDHNCQQDEQERVEPGDQVGNVPHVRSLSTCRSRGAMFWRGHKTLSPDGADLFWVRPYSAARATAATFSGAPSFPSVFVTCPRTRVRSRRKSRPPPAMLP